MSETRPSPLQRALARACDVQPRETHATLASFCLVLVLMTAYYLLRPVRDAMASDWTDAEVSWLWTTTFFFSLAAVSLYGGAIAHIRFRRIVPTVYAFFATTFVAVYIGTQTLADRTLLDKTFYVWVSVFSLFHISVFWSFMADTFSKPQAKRLFAFVGAGASIGGLAGAGIATVLVKHIGTDALLLIASCLLVFTMPIALWIQRLKTTELENVQVSVGAGDLDYLGGNPFSGFTDFIGSRYLLAIALFIFLYTSIGSFVYFELKNLLADYDRAARSQIWSMMDLIVNTMTVVVAMFVTGRLAKHLGLSFTLALVPAIIGVGMLVLAAMPMVSVVVTVFIARRIGNYAISRPAREMLFTAVDRDTRFKTKPVIDIVIYRGGDMLNAWAFTLLTQGLGLGMAGVALVGAGIAACWAATGVYLGRRFRQMEQLPASTETVARET